jgi:hypothetical protein
MMRGFLAHVIDLSFPKVAKMIFVRKLPARLAPVVMPLALSMVMMMAEPCQADGANR